jgi:outer membrane protein
VNVGRDYGNDIEIVSGLNGSEKVISNPNDSVQDQGKVKGMLSNQPPGQDAPASGIQNSGLAGTANPLYQSAAGSSGQPNMVDPGFIGGYGSMLGQIFSRPYQTYEVGIQLNLPIRNRVAQADLARDELQLRTSETQCLKLENQAELELEDAVIGLRRARAAYQAAGRARVLQEQSLELERARLEAGLSTPFFVVQYQSYVAQARSTEVVARGTYFKAKAAMERVLGSSLEPTALALKMRTAANCRNLRHLGERKLVPFLRIGPLLAEGS